MRPHSLILILIPQVAVNERHLMLLPVSRDSVSLLLWYKWFRFRAYYVFHWHFIGSCCAHPWCSIYLSQNISHLLRINIQVKLPMKCFRLCFRKRSQYSLSFDLSRRRIFLPQNSFTRIGCDSPKLRFGRACLFATLLLLVLHLYILLLIISSDNIVSVIIIIVVIIISCYLWWHLLRYVRGFVTSTVMIRVSCFRYRFRDRYDTPIHYWW